MTKHTLKTARGTSLNKRKPLGNLETEVWKVECTMERTEIWKHSIISHCFYESYLKIITPSEMQVTDIKVQNQM